MAPLEMETWVKISEVLHHTATFVAILVGGVWTYVRFVRGRAFTPRISLQLVGSLFSAPSGSYLQVTVMAENKGNTAIEIDHSETAVTAFIENPVRIRQPKWQDFDAFYVLQGVEFVEPDEDVREQHTISLPSIPSGAIMLRLQVRTRAKWYRRGVSEWETSCIVIPGLPQDVASERSISDGTQNDHRRQTEICGSGPSREVREDEE